MKKFSQKQNFCIFAEPLGELAQLARASDWQSGGHRFEPGILHQTSKRELSNHLPFFMRYYTYILYSEKTSRYYYGQTNDLDKRIKRHNSGQVRSTRHGTPWSLIAWKECQNRKEAMRLEKMLKNIHSTEKLNSFLERHQFQISDSSQEVTDPEK